jgi:hypothetical protein
LYALEQIQMVDGAHGTLVHATPTRCGRKPDERTPKIVAARPCLEAGNGRDVPGCLRHPGVGQLHPRSQGPAGHSLGSGPRRGVCADGICRPAVRIRPLRGGVIAEALVFENEVEWPTIIGIAA